MRCIALYLAACGRVAFVPGDGIGGDGVVDTSRPNVAFVSSRAYPASFGSIAAADAICQQHANDAGLAGTFVAMLDSWSMPAPARAASSRGWVDTAGRPIVDQPSGWFDGHMFHALQRNERGELLQTTEMWSGLVDCRGWTSTTPSDFAGRLITTHLFQPDSGSCAISRALVCLEIGHAVPVAAMTVQGRYAFISASPWDPTTIADADTMCQTDATAAGLPGMYRALLATATQSAFARFSLTGATWTRVDAIPLTPTAPELADFTVPLDSFFALTASGTPITRLNWYGTPIASCQDWTSSAAGQVGGYGSTVDIERSLWLDSAGLACSNGGIGLYCLQL